MLIAYAAEKSTGQRERKCQKGSGLVKKETGSSGSMPHYFSKIGLPSGIGLPQQLLDPPAVAGINSHKVVASQQTGLDLSV